MDSSDRVVSHYVYRANASGAGGRFWRVLEDRSERVVPTRSSISLPVTGGRGRSEFEGYTIRAGKLDVLRTGPVVCQAETRGDLAAQTTSTHVASEAWDVWLHPGFEIPYLKGELKSASTAKDEFAPIRTGDCVLREIRLGDRVVMVDLNLDTFRKCDTWEEMRNELKERPRAMLDSSKGVIVANIVEHLRLVGDDDPRIQIKGNTIHWDNFGWIIVGEILISRQYRRLTMVRLELGSDMEGSVSLGEVETDGHTVP